MKINLINSYEIFERVKSGKPFGKNLKSYSKLDIAGAIKILERDEEYEKCHFLNEWYKVRFKHDYNYSNGIMR
jgi:hypothetical protein